MSFSRTSLSVTFLLYVHQGSAQHEGLASGFYSDEIPASRALFPVKAQWRHSKQGLQKSKGQGGFFETGGGFCFGSNGFWG